MNVIDDADGPLDPRIQIELENLNNATDDINRLEIELDEARTFCDQLFSEETKRLTEEINKIGSSCIDKARAYYEAYEESERAKVKCQLEAKAFQRASENHAAAKETVALAEASFLLHRHEWNFDEAWQEGLSQAITKVMDAENQKAACQREHHKYTVLFNEAEKRVQELEEKYRKSIIKAHPYFELKSIYDQKLAEQKERVKCLEESIKNAKRSYSESLRALEEISNQIHQQRRDYDIVANGPREPGVGAELIESEETSNYEMELKKATINRINFIADNTEVENDERTEDFKDINEAKQRVDNLGGRSVDGSESTSSQWELELQVGLEKLNSLSLPESSYSTINHINVSERDSLPDIIEDKKPINLLTIKNLNSSKNNDHNSNSPKKSFLNSITTSQYQGWQSLTQSPINSILAKSRIALKNSFSKSLTGSPVNKGTFTFNRAKTETRVPPLSAKGKDSETSECRLDEEQKTNEDDGKNDSNTRAGYRECCVEKPKLVNDYPIKTPVQKEQMLGCETHSLDSSPIHRTRFSSMDATNTESPASFKETGEFPLLSMFKRPKPYGMAKDKSCSMVNLNEKQQLRNLLDKATLGNIQAVSVERLACARHKLLGDS